MPFIALFGETDFAVRLPIALSSLVSVLVFALLVKELFGKDSKKLSLLAAFVLAVSPWHLIYS